MIQFEEFKLGNGLQVIVHEDPTVQIAVMNILYDVGSRDEQPEKTGFAHLFEHLMFGGSKNIPNYDEPLQKVGGENNAFTNTDITNYYLTVPASNIETRFWLESDRMRSLKVTQENLDNQRNAVQEEKRLRYDNQPYVGAFLRMNELIFKNPANAHSTIGSMEDLDAATIDDVQEFFRIYYAPNNAVLTVVGDFDNREARELVDKYFGNIPKQSNPLFQYYCYCRSHLPGCQKDYRFPC